MKAGALAICACAGVGFALGAGCQRSGHEYPIPDENYFDQQGPPELPGVPNSPDVREPGQRGPESPPPQGRRSPTQDPIILPARVAIDAAEKQVRGKVRYVGPRSVKIEDDQARQFELELTGDTRVTWKGRNASALTFVDGTLLDATYRVDNGALLAMRVEVVTAPE